MPMPKILGTVYRQLVLAIKFVGSLELWNWVSDQVPRGNQNAYSDKTHWNVGRKQRMSIHIWRFRHESTPRLWCTVADT